MDDPDVHRVRSAWVATNDGVTVISSSREGALRACRSGLQDEDENGRLTEDLYDAQEERAG